MAQQIPILKFIKKQNKANCSPYQLSMLVGELICNECTKKRKKGYVCTMNNISFLNLKNNTCAKFEKKR